MQRLKQCFNRHKVRPCAQVSTAHRKPSAWEAPQIAVFARRGSATTSSLSTESGSMASQTPPPSVELPPDSIKAVVWDWDRTVLRIHSFGSRVEPSRVTAGFHDGDYADPEYFKALVEKLVANDVKIFVASFGRYDVIQAYTTRMFGSENPFSRETISTPESLGTVRAANGTEVVHKDGVTVAGQKLPQLDKICREHSLKREEIMFFDDDIRNIVGEFGALSAGFCNSFYCPEAFGRHVWATALQRIRAGDPSGMQAAGKGTQVATAPNISGAHKAPGAAAHAQVYSATDVVHSVSPLLQEHLPAKQV